MLVRSISIMLFWVSAAASAKELVCLKSGFCLQADSHTQTEQGLRFRIAWGSVEFPIDEVASIDAVASTESVASFPPARQPKTDAQALLKAAADAEHLDADFVQSVAKIESGYRQDAISSKGAVGLMQIMPTTAKDLGIEAELAPQNARGGAKYLRTLLLRYHGNSALALAAYNAGPGAVQRFGGVPAFEETRKYIVKVTREYDRQRLASSKNGNRTPER